jgi:hypothetical protein|tara:strand:- start:1285 stop:2163 length:879 start_codon:yes stop_codon:yes gene_type:complete
MSKLKLDNVTLIVIEGRNSHMDMTLKAKNICKWYIDFADVKVLTPQSHYDDKDIFVVNRALDTLQKYNLFAMAELYDYVDTDFCLVINWDSWVCNPKAWTDEFLEYDYIGAWWDIRGDEDSWGGLKSGSTYGKVGNGGFSLRSRRLLKFVQENFKFRRVFDYDAKKPYYDHFNRKIDGTLGYVPGIRPDDQTMARLNGSFLHDNGFKFAPVELAEKFSVEATDATYKDFLNGDRESPGMWEGQFGFHNIWTDLRQWKDLKKWGYETTLPFQDLVDRVMDGDDTIIGTPSNHD